MSKENLDFETKVAYVDILLRMVSTQVDESILRRVVYAVDHISKHSNPHKIDIKEMTKINKEMREIAFKKATDKNCVNS